MKEFEKTIKDEAAPEKSSIEREGGLLRFPMPPGTAESDGHGRITFPMPK